MKFNFNGGMITIEGTSNCLGYLMNFEGHGVFDASIGKVDVTPEQAEKHNKVLDEAMLKGLDETCKVGQYGTFYWTKNGVHGVTTFLGTVVAPRCDCQLKGNSITFTRKGRTFRGRLQKDADCFNFKRIS